MIQVLVSDLGQVVLPFDFTPAKAFLRGHRGSSSFTDERDAWAIMAEIHDRTGFGAGKCTCEEYFQELSSTLGLSCSYEEYCRAFSDVFTEDLAVLNLIRRAKVEHRFLLSNTNAIHWEWILAHHSKALSVFDRLFVSQELGCLKPSPEIYQKVEAQTGLPAAAHLLIDDLSENVSGARECGWDGIIHTNAAHLEEELRRRALI